MTSTAALLCSLAPLRPAGACPEGAQDGATRVKAKPAAVGAFDLRSLKPREHTLDGGQLVADLGHGRRAELTLDPGLQGHVEKLLDRYRVPRAGVVALEPDTGRVLAYVSHWQTDGEPRDMVLDTEPPAASVFKLITAAALLERGIKPTRSTCYAGGYSRLTTAHLRPARGKGRACASFANALGFSINAIFGQLADRHLDRARLERYASAFGFGHALPFDVPTDASPSRIPDERLAFARVSAGFWQVHMSPLHGAMIAATIANRGRMMRPSMVQEVRDGSGKSLHQHSPRLFRSVVGRRTAELLGGMMEKTVARGTARKTFFDAEGRAFLPGVRVAGKTGTLSRERPYRGYTWWVGFAPAERPRIAVAAMLVNTPRWRIKAPLVAREALRHYLFRRSPRVELSHLR